MAKKKSKYDKYYDDQPGLFDFFTDSISEMPVHPSIDDFVVKASEEKTAKTTTPETNDIEMDGGNERGDDDTIMFMSFGSGSSGNCSFIGTTDGGVLIDAGVDGQIIEASLGKIGIDMSSIRGICLTHDHSDHVRYVYSLVRRNPHILIYCTPRVLNGILRRHNISRRIKDYHKPIHKEFPFSVNGLEGFELTAFDVNHDGSDNCGYFISRGKNHFAIATDLGSITERVEYYMRRANNVMIESNYDAAMLRAGKYPAYLKARIAASKGHLDNESTGAFLKDILSRRLSSVFLCHLSQDNNRPEIAVDTVMRWIGEHQEIQSGTMAIPQIVVLPRYGASKLFTLRNYHI